MTMHLPVEEQQEHPCVDAWLFDSLAFEAINGNISASFQLASAASQADRPDALSSAISNWAFDQVTENHNSNNNTSDNNFKHILDSSNAIRTDEDPLAELALDGQYQNLSQTVAPFRDGGLEPTDAMHLDHCLDALAIVALIGKAPRISRESSSNSVSSSEPETSPELQKQQQHAYVYVDQTDFEMAVVDITGFAAANQQVGVAMRADDSVQMRRQVLAARESHQLEETMRMNLTQAREQHQRSSQGRRNAAGSAKLPPGQTTLVDWGVFANTKLNGGGGAAVTDEKAERNKRMRFAYEDDESEEFSRRGSRGQCGAASDNNKISYNYNNSSSAASSAFVSARQRLDDQNAKTNGRFSNNNNNKNNNNTNRSSGSSYPVGENGMNNSNNNCNNNKARGRSLGGGRRRSNFRAPARMNDDSNNNTNMDPSSFSAGNNCSYNNNKNINKNHDKNNSRVVNSYTVGSNRSFNPAASAQAVLNNESGGNNSGGEPEVDPRLKNIDPALVERIESEVLDISTPVTFDDIAGLEFAKQNIEEAVVWPIRSPEIYTGLRQLPKGLLLFGPPGTGKTMIGKAIAHEVKATFFSISASSLTSKWIGEGEKTVRALFAVAGVRAPSVVFIDEVDSLLCQRSSDENEASRRIKTEFLVQLDGAATSADELVLVIGATNRPQELDEAARRRFVKRLYIPLPEAETRDALLRKLMRKNENGLTETHFQDLTKLTAGYSGADLTNLAREASMGPVRDFMRAKKGRDSFDPAMRPIQRHDFNIAMRSVRASVSSTDLDFYIKWNEQFGTQQYIGGEEEVEDANIVQDG